MGNREAKRNQIPRGYISLLITSQNPNMSKKKVPRGVGMNETGNLGRSGDSRDMERTRCAKN